MHSYKEEFQSTALPPASDVHPPPFYSHLKENTGENSQKLQVQYPYCALFVLSVKVIAQRPPTLTESVTNDGVYFL